MENITINKDSQSDGVWTLNIADKQLYLNMPYDVFCHEFAKYIDHTHKSVHDNILSILVPLKTYDCYIYDQEVSNIEVYFLNNKIYKIILNLSAAEATVQSSSTGIRLYQDKIKQLAKNIKKIVVAQFGETDDSETGETDDSETHFRYEENGCLLCSSIDRDSIHYYILLTITA